MATISVKLLDKVIHNGRFAEVGESLELDAEQAKGLVERGIAEAEGVARRALRRAKSGDETPADSEE